MNINLLMEAVRLEREGHFAEANPLWAKLFRGKPESAMLAARSAAKSAPNAHVAESEVFHIWLSA